LNSSNGRLIQLPLPLDSHPTQKLDLQRRPELISVLAELLLAATTSAQTDADAAKESSDAR
jgi:hypothetical protein